MTKQEATVFAKECLGTNFDNLFVCDVNNSKEVLIINTRGLEVPLYAIIKLRDKFKAAGVEIGLETIEEGCPKCGTGREMGMAIYFYGHVVEEK